MGWTSYNTNKSFREVFEDEFEHRYPLGTFLLTQEYKITGQWKDDDCDEESEFFSAMRYKNTLLCFTVMMKRFGREVMWKEQDESVGPYMKHKCPKNIMKLLSPVEKLEYPGYSKEWRERQ